MNCPECNKEIPDQSLFCLHCGAGMPQPAAVTHCTQCGKELAEKANFCAVCGTPVERAPAPLPTQEAQKETPPTSPKKKRRLLLALPSLAVLLVALLVFARWDKGEIVEAPVVVDDEIQWGDSVESNAAVTEPASFTGPAPGVEPISEAAPEILPTTSNSESEGYSLWPGAWLWETNDATLANFIWIFRDNGTIAIYYTGSNPQAKESAGLEWNMQYTYNGTEQLLSIAEAQGDSRLVWKDENAFSMENPEVEDQFYYFASRIDEETIPSDAVRMDAWD